MKAKIYCTMITEREIEIPNDLYFEDEGYIQLNNEKIDNFVREYEYKNYNDDLRVLTLEVKDICLYEL